MRNGWIVDDIDNTDPIEQQAGKGLGWELLVTLCPQTQTLPKIGGGYVCSDEADDVWVMRYPDLKSRPESAVLARENKSITTSDFLAYRIQYEREVVDVMNHRLLKNIDRTFNVTDPQTNQAISTAPAKYVEMSYANSEGERVGDFSLLVPSNDGNTGYVLDSRASLLTAAGELLLPKTPTDI